MTTTLEAVAHALAARGVRHNLTRRGERIATDCPACGKTGRPGRRPVVVIRKFNGLAGHADCGCELTDIARALELPAGALLNYRKVHLPSTRDADGKNNAKSQCTHPAAANAWGVTRTATKLRRGNLRGVIRVAEDMDRASAKLAPGDWLSYDSRRAARELGMDRHAVRRALRWLIAHNILEERQLPAPEGEPQADEKGRVYRKSGVKQYRPLNDAQQIKRLARRRADPA